MKDEIEYDIIHEQDQANKRVFLTQILQTETQSKDSTKTGV